MEAISIAKAMAARTRQNLDADRELIGQGMSNIVGSLFQSYPVSGSFSRSAVNFQAGAVTGVSSGRVTIIAWQRAGSRNISSTSTDCSRTGPDCKRPTSSSKSMAGRWTAFAA